MRGYKAASFILSDRTEKILKNLSASYSEPSYVVLRSKIVLMAAQEKTNSQIAGALGTAYATVSTWRKGIKKCCTRICASIILLLSSCFAFSS